MNEDDWIYRDMPKTHPDNYLNLIEIIGQGNYELLSYATYPVPVDKCDKGFVVRSQLMISPQGMKNLDNYLTRSREDL